MDNSLKELAESTVKTEYELCSMVRSDHRSQYLEGKNCDGLDCGKCKITKQALYTTEVVYQDTLKRVREEIEKEIHRHEELPHHEAEIGALEAILKVIGGE